MEFPLRLLQIFDLFLFGPQPIFADAAQAVVFAAQGGQGYWAWPNLAAVYMIVVAPGIIAFTFAQKLFFKGLMEGVAKG